MADSTEIVLPPLLPYPPKTIRERLLPQEWDSCLELWISSVELRLNLLDSQLSKVSVDSLAFKFIISYCSQNAIKSASINHGTQDDRLHRICRIYICHLVASQASRVPPASLFDLLGSGSLAFEHSEQWKRVLRHLWATQPKLFRKAAESVKARIESPASLASQILWLRKVSALTRAFPSTATVTVAGADYLDILTDLYRDGSSDLKKAATENLFCSLVALLQDKHITILTDDIYHLKSESDRIRKSQPETITLLSSLLCTTSFPKHFAANTEIAAKKKALVDQLIQYRHDMSHLHPLPPRPRKKGKERASDDHGMHMHQAALVSQIHELFPHLTTAYSLRVLEHFHDDTEASIAALLEPDTLPPSLQNQNVADSDLDYSPPVPDLEPKYTPEPSAGRTGMINQDEFDRLEISSQQIRRGKKAVNDELVTADGHAKSKAAILSALAAFDADDDERDDTYDIADVGGAVDNTVDSDERRHTAGSAYEGALFKSWKENPELFARDSKTRASNIRQQLKRETGLGDEQIEGWAIMLTRDRKMQDRLTDKYSSAGSFAGQQKSIGSTRWQANTSTDNSETEGGPERSTDARRMGQAGIRGHRDFGRGRGRGGGNTSGPAEDAATQQARKRKEQGRGRGGANHRRDARAKKIGRGMGPISQG